MAGGSFDRRGHGHRRLIQAGGETRNGFAVAAAKISDRYHRRGKYLYFVRRTLGKASMNLWRMDSDGTNLTQLPFAPTKANRNARARGRPWVLYVDRGIIQRRSSSDVPLKAGTDGDLALVRERLLGMERLDDGQRIVGVREGGRELDITELAYGVYSERRCKKTNYSCELVQRAFSAPGFRARTNENLVVYVCEEEKGVDSNLGATDSIARPSRITHLSKERIMRFRFCRNGSKLAIDARDVESDCWGGPGSCCATTNSH